MKSLNRIVLVACLVLAAGGITLALREARRAPFARETPEAPASSPSSTASGGESRNASTGGYELVMEKFEDGGYGTAIKYMAEVHDSASLQELREAVRGRARRGLAALKPKYDALKLDNPPTPAQALEKLGLERSIGFLYMYEGQFLEAASWMETALKTAAAPGVSADDRTRLIAILGVIAMRRGEIENCLECVGPSSCIFPITEEALHKNPAGSRDAVKWFTAYLKERPRDLRVIWLMNIARMTLGESPANAPSKDWLPINARRSKLDVGRFANVASTAGLGERGPNLAGGSIFDDFNGDGLPDLVTTSLDADLGASFFVNKGNGRFEDHTAAAGLGNQVYALNVTRTDYDNDGDLDLLLLRGGWEAPARLSLLRNKGDNTFDDVTLAAGLGAPISTESAAWGDYDSDGLLDVFVCGEFLGPGAAVGSSPGEPRNRCRLYKNKGDGTFVDVAEKAGVTNERCAKGSAWGDYDGDGKPDLFVSNMGQECRLYHNEGQGVFRDVAPELGVTGPAFSFACWFWDFDNDGKLDLYVNDYHATVAEVLATAMGLKVEGSSRPHLYKNLGHGTFRDVAREVGLDRAMAPMGANFGDIDNDGFFDVYLGTGDMSYEGLDVDLMFKNVGGRKFEDVTESSGTGHLQKGHGVSFADWDNDGDLDIFVELGGATPGDQGYNALFQNPGHGRNWLKLKLVGTKTNRPAIGAEVRADVKSPDGTTRSIFRTVGQNGSFGGNSLVESLGLLEADSVASLTIHWPTSGTTQTFHDIAANQLIEITEGADAFKSVPLPKVKFPVH